MLSIGQYIKKLSFVCSTTSHVDGVSAQTSVSVNVEDAPDAWFLGHLKKSVAILFQKPIRALKGEDIVKKYHGTTIHWSTVGKKVRPREEEVAEYTSAGIPQNIAEKMVDDADYKARVFARMAELEIEEEEDDTDAESESTDG